ncbi:uncharacterized protein BX663DRAFT_504351 [Cokeromyces recurvatus]|uniref:uncharacterized protein n=1 Tax=Cokeromyces recurvatus TaxID=90255 RepID=UPI00221F8E5D|nr:uncharacterized protein BX663DRAFT_504351 [Cokeromyces recurvatus]KAI7904221.1 hypothetical protein BX663DRAFT_504351 [Cokeromyces recurvatus]
MKSCVNYELEIERLKQLVPAIDNRKRKSTYSNLPDNTDSDSTTSSSSSSSSCSSSSSNNAVTEEEKLRFLAFVRSWTGDWQQKPTENDLINLNNDYSLWADPLPWTISLDHSASHTMMSSNTYNNYLSYWQPQQPVHVNRHGQLPIGMGRKRS